MISRVCRMLGCALLLLPLVACGVGGSEAAEPRTLTVFAAASLTEVFRELGREFEAQHPGVRVSLNVAGSQQLLAQLEHGASADVFAPASPRELDAAQRSLLIAKDSRRTFAANRLIVVYAKEKRGRLGSLADLAQPGLKLVIADQSVPAGRYARELLAALRADSGFGPEFTDKLLANVVSHEGNVRAVLSKVQLGEADAGIVYSSDVVSAGGEELGTLAIPEQLNPVAHYVIAPLREAADPELAQAFVELALSERGQQVLRAYGFIAAQPDQP